MYGFDSVNRRESWIEPLPPGHAGTMHTLSVMRALAQRDSRQREVCETVNAILQQPGFNTLSPVAALFLFARDAIRYKPDPPDLEQITDFIRLTQSRAEDCDGKVQWLATALLCLGYSVRFVIQSYDGQYQTNGWDHIYLEFYDFDQWGWVAADPTADGHNGFVAELGWRQPTPAGGAEMTFEV